MEHNKELCCKCQKYRIANKKYMLCKFCNFERTHDGLTVWENNVNKLIKKPKKRDLNLAIIRDPILTPRIRLCKVLGCTNNVKGKTGYCTSHTKIKTKNRKKTAQQERSSSVAQEMSIIKKKAKEKHYLENDGSCEGCGKTNNGLDYSHILSVGQRKDLELEKNNKNLLCRTCHIAWESWDMKKMFKLNCINYNLNYIRKQDEQTFWRLYFKCIDNQEFTYAKHMEQIDEEFKKQQ